MLLIVPSLGQVALSRVDESLAPLDPGSRCLVVNAILNRVKTVVVVAHP